MCTKLQVLTLLCMGLLLGGCGAGSGRGSVATGNRYQDQGEYRAAYIEAKKVLQRDDKNAAAWLLLGKASLMLGNPKDALSDLQSARTYGVPKAQWVVPMGQLLRATRQYDTLLQDVSDTGITDPTTSSQVNVLRGDAYLGLDQYDHAAQSFQTALKQEPRMPGALSGLARVSAAKGDMASADQYLQQALAAAPEDPRVWLAKGDLAVGRKDLATAETAFQKALSFKHPGWSPEEHFYALTRLADTQAQLSQFDKTLSTVSTLEKGWPGQPYPHYLHALVLYNQGHLDQATSQLQQVLKVQPDSIQAQLLSGAVNYAQGNYAQAEMYLSNVMGMDQKNVQARKLLALTFYREGRSHQALDTLRTVAPEQWSDTQLLALLQKAATTGIRGNETHGPAGNSSTAENPQLAQAREDIISGDSAKAIRLLKSMHTSDAPTEASRISLLVMAYLSSKQTELAVQTAADFAARHPKDSAADLLYGTALVAAGKRTEARTQFTNAHDLDSTNVTALLSLGSLDALEGHYKDATTRYESALKLSPGNAEALTALGRIDMLNGDKSSAIKRFKQAIAAAPKSPSAYLGLMLLYRNNGQLDEAGNTAKQLVKAAPDNPEALNVLGATELSDGNYNQALGPLKQAVSLAPSVALFRTNLARAQVLNKDTKQAKDNLLEVLKTNPSQLTAVSLLAFIKSQDNDLPGAIALARGLQKQPATQAAGFGLEGDLYMAHKAWSKAAQAYQEGLKAHYSREFVLKNFIALEKSGARHSASGLRDWLNKHPDDGAARLLLGQHYLGQGQNTEAADQYKKVLESFPTNLAALNNLAWIYVQQHNPEGMKLAEKAYKLAPQSPGVADTYGWAMISANQPARALPILTKAAAAAPRVATIQYHLAVAQVRTGDKAAARATLQSLLATKTDFPEKPAAEQLYQTVGGGGAAN
ncbi:XrtA/PEP-CTERM system TPR-repeat protein PrsT [Dyella sp. A6]|uniref:XrtA/PEP-CTERM system TPR-repeat protein PrsT n=1 Tax=Dyella aluminiiresistens TaxID=3069105 RepID=UPI002E760603|nr:XrtA/PEP-CTERM system TPR-repeat protein PrsT [Dyella sp. A6]